MIQLSKGQFVDFIARPAERLEVPMPSCWYVLRSHPGKERKVIDTLYSTPERDKFRTRLERTASGSTEIYISHRGMQEVYSTTTKDQTVWQPRPTDPELEAEFLRRLMVKLGVTQEQSKAADPAAHPPPRAALPAPLHFGLGIRFTRRRNGPWRRRRAVGRRLKS